MEKPWAVTWMMKTGPVLSALFSLLLLLPLCKQKNISMETRTSVKGILRTASGQPMKDAIVMISQGSHSFNDIAAVTNDSGEFYLSNIVVPGNYTLQINTDSGSVQKQVSLQSDQSISLTY